MNFTRGNRKCAEAEPTNAWPYHNRFYSLALQPMSRNPYSFATAIR